MKMNHECMNCGNTVSNYFARVYGDNNNDVHHCLDCVSDDPDTGRELIRRGAAAYETVEKAEERLKGTSNGFSIV